VTRLEKIELAIEKGITCNPETGQVFGVRGKEMISKDNNGYSLIKFQHKKKNYKLRSHQFIWYCVHKQIVSHIDHINQDKSDNRIVNLRTTNNMENCHNNSSLGYTKIRNKYRAKIKVNYKTIHIGYFDTSDEAREAYLQAKKHYFPTIYC
jgi:hypothetical protein